MKRRSTLHSISDLLPEVLIEAQGCDEITAKAALRRAVETLCQNHSFGEQDLWFSVDKDDVTDENEVILPIDESIVSRINSVSYKGSRHQYVEISAFWENGRLYIPSNSLPIDTSRNGHKIGVKVNVDAMPDVDADIEDFERFTKWRHLIVDVALEDLLSMEGKPWANNTRYQFYARRALHSIEEFLLNENYSRGKVGERFAGPNPACSIWH